MSVMHDKAYVRFNAILVIPEAIEAAAIELSKKIGEHEDEYFTLGKERCYAHITLYSPEYPESAKEAVIAIVGRIADRFPPVHCSITRADSREGFIGLAAELTPEIRMLHTELVVSLNPLREGRVREKFAADDLGKFTGEEVKNIEIYGRPSVLSLYHPHLTIVRLRDEQRAKDVAATLDVMLNDFSVNTLALYEMGEHGTCQRLIQHFPLAGRA